MGGGWGEGGLGSFRIDWGLGSRTRPLISFRPFSDVELREDVGVGVGWFEMTVETPSLTCLPPGSWSSSPLPADPPPPPSTDQAGQACVALGGHALQSPPPPPRPEPPDALLPGLCWARLGRGDSRQLCLDRQQPPQPCGGRGGRLGPASRGLRPAPELWLRVFTPVCAEEGGRAGGCAGAAGAARPPGSRARRPGRAGVGPAPIRERGWADGAQGPGSLPSLCT